MIRRVGTLAEAGREYSLFRAIPQVVIVLAVFSVAIIGGSLRSAVLSPAWAEEGAVAEEETDFDGCQQTACASIAFHCPDGFTDGDPSPPDLNFHSCHTELVKCQEGESPLNCGKRALMSGDWDRALRAFNQATFEQPEDFGEAIYGRYLARLFRLYAHYNNMFFEDVWREGFNQKALTRDLNNQEFPWGRIYQQQYTCLVNQVFFPENLAYGVSLSLLDQDLERIVEGQYTLRGLNGGPLEIRWVQGKCSAPLFDAVFSGVWDWVDAVIIYLHLYGSPAETKRFHGFAGPEDKSSTEPCDNELCGPYQKDGQDVPRLPRDAEWLLDLLFRASQTLFTPGRFVSGQEPVFFWRDTNGNGTVDASDLFTVQLYKTGTNEPLMALEDVTLGAQWIPRQADPPVNPAPMKTFIFCPQGQEDPSCQVLPGELVLEESPPVWQQLLTNDIAAFPSPDGSKLLFPKMFQKTIGDQEVREWHFHIADNALDAEGNPICSAPDGDCCLTCRLPEFPVGIRLAEPGNRKRRPIGPPAFWIPDPANPQGPARGVFFMHNERPSAWGFRGQAQATQFFAVRPDGSGLSRLLEEAPPGAFHYQPRVSPDGAQILWSSTWDPVTNRPSSHTLLLADLAEENGGFRLANVHSFVPVRDHGFYETGDFALDYPNDPRIYFTSSSHSMQSGRIYVATLTPGGVIDEVFKLTFPEEVLPEPFTIDFQPGWYEFASPVDGGWQFTFITSTLMPIAMDRFDRFLAFPPYLEGSFIGLTLFDIKFAGGGDIGYQGRVPRALANIDGTDLRSPYEAANQAGWIVVTKQERVVDGQIFFTQTNSTSGASRNGVIKFVE